MKFLNSLLLTLAICLVSAVAETETQKRLDGIIGEYDLNGLIRTAIGVTRDDTPIPAFITEEDLDPEAKPFRILLIGGLDGKVESTRAVLEAMAWFQEKSEEKDHFAISAVPCARPDILSGNDPSTPDLFPPKGSAYNQPKNDAAHYLWRWTGMHAPDLVVEVRVAEKRGWVEPNQVSDVPWRIPILPRTVELFQGQDEDLSFPVAAFSHQPCEIGGIHSLQWDVAKGTDGQWLAESIPSKIGRQTFRSEARQEVIRRISRSPIEIATELSKVYGRKLDSIMYIPSLAVVGQMRLGELTDDPQPLRDAENLADPFRSGEKESMPAKGNGSTLSGHLVFSELARRTGDAGWTALAKKVADYGFDENGKPKESMPFHSEMSDSVFMGCAILAEVGELTGEQKYFDQCLRHLKFMENLCLRDDGLYRHSPLDEAAWGRGNGFPALGMALSLSALPEDSEAHAYFLKSYRAHLEALRKHQDPTGAWHQVIDHEESYREFTSTCMITFAIVRGIRRGWLDKKEWAPVVELAWQAIKSRIGPNGRLVDVCTGTGKQKNLRAYFDRTAILGPDGRGGAMGLMVSTEMAFWEREK